MSEYKRLTGINEEGVALPINGTKYPLDDDTEKCLERLAELEDKIESGTLVEIPCKVGDTIYFIDKVSVGKWEVLKGEVLIVLIGSDNRVQINYYNDEGISFLIWNGKNCYLTKSQAEARLKELKGEEGV